MFDLSEKVALVTGGSRGLGRAASTWLARAGAYVVVNYRGNEEAAQATLADIEKQGGKGELLRFDVADPEDVDASITVAAKRLGRLDILVNNAGISIDQLLLRVTSEDLDKTWTTNLNGPIYCAKAAVRTMMRARRGRIVNVSSVVGELGNAGQAAYAASKAGVVGLTKSLAREYASRGITVNAVAPGFIETDMTAGLNDKQRQAIVAQTPLGRVGNPDEVAAAILFLCSDEASYITGQVVRVNGGMYV